MTRRLINLLTAGSLLLCVAVVVCRAVATGPCLEHPPAAAAPDLSDSSHPERDVSSLPPITRSFNNELWFALSL